MSNGTATERKLWQEGKDEITGELSTRQIRGSLESESG